MKHVFCYIFLFLVFTGRAQNYHPGGVAGEKLWYTSVGFQNGSVGWKDELRQLLSESKGIETQYINFNPALPVNSNNFPKINQYLDLSKATLFVVYQSVDSTYERAIWNVQAQDRSGLILTTSRVGDLSEAQYMNFAGSSKGFPTLNTYFQFLQPSDISMSKVQLHLGTKPASPALPIQPFEGWIPEFILYERVLSETERNQVETYLALKYGLNFSSTKPFLNSSGEIIWDNKANKEYQQRITGIGRDDKSGLLQKQSTSSYASHFLTISAGEMQRNNQENKTEIPESTFLVWADNGVAPYLEPVAPAGQPKRMAQRWLMQKTGDADVLSTTLQFDKKGLWVTPSESETWWLVIDRSGTGKFPAGATDYIPACPKADDRFISFQKVNWTTEKSIFCLALAKDLISKVWIEEPACEQGAKGSFFIGAQGGIPPYQFTLITGHNKENKNWQGNDQDLHKIVDLFPGEYHLTIQDKNGKKLDVPLFLQNTGAPEISLEPHYQLSNDKVLNLTGGYVHPGFTFLWTGPEGFVSKSHGIHITQPGLYSLSIDSAGCIAHKTFWVDPSPSSIFQKVELFPNPSQDGRFNLQAQLAIWSDLEVSVLDASGRILSTHNHRANKRHIHAGRILHPGTYLVRLNSQGNVKTLPLVVSKVNK